MPSKLTVAPNTLLAIAKKHLGLDTLEARNSDSLDFKEYSVWQIRKALEEAYKAGQASIRQPRASHKDNAQQAIKTHNAQVAELTHKMKTLILSAVKQAGTYDPTEVLPYIEEALTPKEYTLVEGFLKAVCDNEQTLHFGFGNINEVWVKVMSGK